jgi:hypothetical protein
MPAAFEETGGASWVAVDTKYIFHVVLLRRNFRHI